MCFTPPRRTTIAIRHSRSSTLTEAPACCKYSVTEALSSPAVTTIRQEFAPEAMHVDRYRFVTEPSAFQVAQRSPLRDLAFDYRRKTRDIAALLKNGAAVARGYYAFADKASRAIFKDLLVYRYLTPHLSHVANNEQMFNALEAFMRDNFSAEVLPTDINILGESMAVWSVHYNNIPVQIVTTKYGLYWTLISDQYHFCRGDIFIGPEEGDVILDCGSFVGDTAIKFATYTGATGKIYSFDPVRSHAMIARDSVARNHLDDRIEIFSCGVSRTSKPSASAAIEDVSGQAEETLIASPGRPLSVTDTTISIDDFCRLRGLTSVDYIKMDIEGSEAEALEGASETITRLKPKLAICLYHKPSDLWTIPYELKLRYPFYKMYLEHYSLHAEETVMYAIASDGTDS
jgi:FkbM family methyltransferase